MRCIPNYRVGYNGKFYEAGHEFQIDSKDAEEMKQHGRVLEDPTSPPDAFKKPARRTRNVQSSKA